MHKKLTRDIGNGGINVIFLERCTEHRHTNLEKKCHNIPWTWTHTYSKKESWLPKGDKNIKEGVRTKRKIVIEKESLK
jgi:hypothetical protein